MKGKVVVSYRRALCREIYSSLQVGSVLLRRMEVVSGILAIGSTFRKVLKKEVRQVWSS